MSFNELKNFLKKNKFNKCAYKDNAFWQDNGMYSIIISIYNNNTITIHFEIDDDHDFDFPTKPIIFYNITKNTLEGILKICRIWINEVYNFI